MPEPSTILGQAPSPPQGLPPGPPSGAPRKSFFWDSLPTVIMFGVGVAALGFTAWQCWHMAVFLAHASRATGVIVDARQHQRVGFTTADGREVVFVQNGGLDRPLGAEVPVAYDPADPAGTAQAETIWTTWVSALWGLPIGLGFTILPLLGVRASWNVERYLRSDR